MANATHVSQFGFFERGATRELILLVACTVAQPGHRQSVSMQHHPSSDLPRATTSLVIAQPPEVVVYGCGGDGGGWG
ncbi:VAMP-like protein [Hordeum vulgare]|nr:VAMP-like protein [Hordeum vulgare]